MSKQHQKSEDQNREELTGNKVPLPGMEPRTVQAETQQFTTELPSSSELSVQQRVQSFDLV